MSDGLRFGCAARGRGSQASARSKRARSRRPMAARGGGCSSNVRPTAGVLCHAPQSRFSAKRLQYPVGWRLARAAIGERNGRDQSRSVATERCQQLEARPADHRLCSLRQLRDRAVLREARGSHPRGSPGRVWGHPRGDRAPTRRRARRPRAWGRARGPRTARSLLGRPPCRDWGPCTSRSRKHANEGSSATRLGRSAWPSDHSVMAATASEARRRMTASASRPRIRTHRSRCGFPAATMHPPGPAGRCAHSSTATSPPPKRKTLHCSSANSSPTASSTPTSAPAEH